jgi:hypothetical protein
MAENGEMSTVGKALLDFSSKWMLPFVLAFVSWQYTEISKLEDRVGALQREAVTHSELQLTESRMVGLLDLRIKNLADQQKVTNEYLRILIDQKASRP